MTDGLDPTRVAAAWYRLSRESWHARTEVTLQFTLGEHAYA